MPYILYALTLLCSSALLFAVQPMVAKMIQPLLGGTPAVWNTAMVFFQGLLLLGYLYAHFATRLLGVRRQSLLHLAVVAGGILFLPVAFEAPTTTAILEAPTLWLLVTLGVVVGWPFFVVSTTAPLLQRWFAALDHRFSADPYPLYAASNLGSLLALLAYPLMVEPRWGLTAQATLWMAGYLLLLGMLALCCAQLWRIGDGKDGGDDAEQLPAPRAAPPAAGTPVTWWRRGRWILWAFIPSSLMLSVTTFVPTDIAPVPLLWIPPLAIYLFSFAWAFARREVIPQRWWLLLFFPALGASAAVLAVGTSDPLWAVTALLLATLFIFSIYFHGLLSADRPHPRDLTDFYLWVALGGVLGGIFNALIAPAIFDRLLEYPFLLLAAAVAVPATSFQRRSVVVAAIVGLVGGGIYYGAMTFPGVDEGFWSLATFASLLGAAAVVPAVLVVRYRRLAPLFVAAPIALLLVGEIRPEPDEIFAARSFYGAHQVVTSPSGQYHVLYHGRTIHGAQARDPDQRLVPRTYYYYSGPLGQVFDALAERATRHPLAAVGLGTGAVASYVNRSQRLDFFEIDPVVVEIATDEDYFTFSEDCSGDCQIHLGDGRLHLAAAAPATYELIVLDAYSSSAIPVHLLTREAIAIYINALDPRGILAIHISSPYLDLSGPLAGAARELGMTHRVQRHIVSSDEELYGFFVDSSEWLIIARNEEALGPLAADSRWEEVAAESITDAWTDDYANLLEVYLW